jgi:glycosyltransferase involved in cell wall biosynthesis
MNVLNIVIDNNIGGIQNRVIMVAEKLKKFGVNTIILAPKSSGNFSKIAKDKEFLVYQTYIESPKYFTSVRNILKNIFWFLSFPIAVLSIIKIIKKEKVEIVHVNGLLALQGVIAARLVKKPLVWHLISSLYPGLLVSIIRPLFKWANKIVLVTNLTRSYYIGDYNNKEKVSIIYEPVDIEHFNSKKIYEEKKNDIRHKLAVFEDYKIVSFIGNISTVKGIEYFIEVVHEVVNKTNTKVKFLIVGEVSVGYIEYFATLKKQIAELNLDNDIVFLGKIPHSQIRDILSVVDIFLMTSIAEGTPLVILEAMSMGIPVVATDVGGISEQVANGKTGIVVPPKDVNAIAEAVLYLLENDEIRKQYGINARERIVKFFSLNKCVEEHQLLYEDIIV